MARLIEEPRKLLAGGNKPKIINEYIGLVNSGDKGISIAHMESPVGWTEPGQTPELDEFTVVIKGELTVKTRDQTFEVKTGQAFIADKGEWVQYATPHPEGAEYISVCLPAWSRDLVNKDK